ncbi:MAG: hypothetical protein ACRDFB_08135 [Rhabdochlamydiaceae bacterium]
MKTLHLSILIISTVSFATILFFAITATTTPPDANNFSSKHYAEETKNTVQSVSEAPLCVTHIKNQTIDAGYLGDFSCPAPEFFTQTKILKINGFYGVYHNSTNDRTDTYALEPGHDGMITYAISGHALSYEGTIPEGLIIKNQTEISNDAIYIHHQVITMPQTVRVTYQTEPNGSKVPYHYWACHKAASGYPDGGEECYGGPGPVPSDHITVDAMLYSHLGIDVEYKPQSEKISNNGTITVNVTISAASDAPTGTYWIILSPGQCNGGQILLLAVTKCSDVK